MIKQVITQSEESFRICRLITQLAYQLGQQQDMSGDDLVLSVLCEVLCGLSGNELTQETAQDDDLLIAHLQRTCDLNRAKVEKNLN